MSRAIAKIGWLICASLLLFTALAVAPCRAQSESRQDSGQSSGGSAGTAESKIAADAFVAWWMHDATGYHPAIYLILQNASNVDLSWKPIKFQAHFRDLRNGYVTVARSEIRRDFAPGQEIYLLLEGPNPFELPIDKMSWPSIECKVMVRADSVDEDEATQTVLITKVEQTAMTDDEAKQRILDVSHPRMLSHRAVHRADHGETERPMVAQALPLSGPGPHPKTTKTAAAIEHRKDLLSHFLSSPHMVGLGDDYFELEQAFGKPIEFVYTHDTKWTWARYANTDPPFALYAGARGHASKVDSLVLVVPAGEVQQDSQLLTLARSLAGKSKSQALSSPNKTVKYLNSGRIQLTTASAPSYKVFFTSPRGSSADENYFVLGLSRVPGDFRAVLDENAKRVPMLRFIAPIVADEEPE